MSNYSNNQSGVGIYRVEELAAAGGVSVDTIRYYQGLGLLDPPSKRGRVAVYEESHRERLAAIRSLADSGFTLRQIGDLVEVGEGVDSDPLLRALDRHRTGGPVLSIDQLSSRTGVAVGLLELAVGAGLLRPADRDGHPVFDEGQAAMVETFGRLVAAGMDPDPLLSLAARHADAIEHTVDDGVELYRRAAEAGGEVDRKRVADEIQALIPAVTKLVADHFARTLVERAAAIVDGP